MSQPAPITADRTWDDLLRMIEGFLRAVILTYDDIREFHERERPMSQDLDNDIPQPDTTAFEIEDTADRRDQAGQPARNEPDLHDDERRREEEELQARQDDLDLEP